MTLIPFSLSLRKLTAIESILRVVSARLNHENTMTLPLFLCYFFGFLGSKFNKGVAKKCVTMCSKGLRIKESGI